MNKSVKPMNKNFKTLFYSSVGVLIFFALINFTNATPVGNNEELDNYLNSPENEEFLKNTELIKRAIDKFRYLGGIGKRLSDNQMMQDSDEENFDSNEPNVFKRLDKMRYIGNIGKRTTNNIIKKSRTNNIDKLRYLGNIGK